MSTDDIKKGESVVAKWAGSKMYYEATVTKSTKQSQEVEVEFKDGTKRTVKKSEIKKAQGKTPKSSPKKASVSRSRSRSKGRVRAPSPPPPSPKRSRSKSKTKSPARATSAKRSPGRPRSKSRKMTPSPASPKKTKSPNRATTKKRETSLSPAKKTPQRGRPRSSVSTAKPSVSMTVVSTSSISTSGLKEFSIKAKKLGADEETQIKALQNLSLPSFKEKMAKLEDNQIEESERIFATRLRSRGNASLLEKREITQIKSMDHFDTVDTRPTKPEAKAGVSFLGSLGSLVVLFGFPLLVIFLILACARNQGKLFEIPPLSKTWRFYITPLPTAIFAGFVLLQGLLQLLPIGPVIEGFVEASKVPRRNYSYRKNGLIALIITLSIVPITIYLNKLPSEFIRGHFLHLASASIVFSFIFSIALYIKSFYAPPHEIHPYGDSKFFYHNLTIGRQLNPRMGNGLDFKFLVFHVGLIGWALVDVLLVYKVYASNQSIHCTLAMTVTMQLLYIVDLLWREEQGLATASVKYEGIGFQRILGICTMNPFTTTLPVLYLVDRKTDLSYYKLAGIALLYIIGFYLSRKSNSMKYALKKNMPGTRNYRTISSGKRSLLCSGPWGFVRHPNFLGDILVFLAWTLPCDITAGVPYVPFVTITLLLIWRTFVVDSHMQSTYGNTFAEYKQVVPKRLIPYVF